MQKITSLPNLNGNPLAAIDVETTGLEAGYHEIVQIAIVPLTIELEVADVKPFYQNIRPNFPDRASAKALKTHGIDLDDLMRNSPDQKRVIEFLIEWFDSLNLGHKRKLTPVAHNWGFERSFLASWLGLKLFDELIYHHPRDTMSFGILINDRAAMLGKSTPFHRVGLADMCRKCGIPLTKAHDALADSIATAKLYSYLMRAVIT